MVTTGLGDLGAGKGDCCPVMNKQKPKLQAACPNSFVEEDMVVLENKKES